MNRKKINTNFIVVTGGVLSGLGKGVSAASIGAILGGKLKVIPVKCDGYLNTDPGTMNPTEHGEVYVLDDGGEVDMDFGHYERFLNIQTKFKWNLTMGKIFKEILDKERHGDYLGKTVQFLPHVTDLIKAKFFEIAEEENADILLIEVGGTVGDLENQFYLEAVRQLSHDVGNDKMVYVHLTYVPIPSGVGEQKTKPTQMSVRELNEKGIYPDIIIGRSSEYLEPNVKEKIAMFCNTDSSHVISGVDVNNVYEIPMIYDKEGLSEILHKKMRIYSPPNLSEWSKLVGNINRNLKSPRQVIHVAICGKYMALEDSYASVVEAISHAAAHLDVKAQIAWIDTEEIEKKGKDVSVLLKNIDAVIVPGGFGTRGIEGKISVIKYCRETQLPFLGICYGMQLAVVEYARHVCGMEKANTAEARRDGMEVEIPVVDILPGQESVKDMGATMRLGGHDVLITKDSKAHEVYESTKIRARFRHRFEINPEYVPQLEAAGLVFSGKASKENIMQLMELPQHAFFMACQFHPELTSTLMNPAPLFKGLLKTAIAKNTETSPIEL